MIPRLLQAFWRFQYLGKSCGVGFGIQLAGSHIGVEKHRRPSLAPVVPHFPEKARQLERPQQGQVACFGHDGKPKATGIRLYFGTAVSLQRDIPRKQHQVQILALFDIHPTVPIHQLGFATNWRNNPLWK